MSSELDSIKYEKGKQTLSEEYKTQQETQDYATLLSNKAAFKFI